DAYGLSERALAIDGRNVRALTNLTYKFVVPVLTLSSSDPAADTRRAEELVSRALAVDPNAYAAHLAKSYVLVVQKRAEEAIIAAERSLALNPSYVNAYDGLCVASMFLGRMEEVVDHADRAIRLSPRDPDLFF